MSAPPENAALQKASLRDAALKGRDGLEIDDRLGWDQEIAERALALFDDILGRSEAAQERYLSADLVSAYWPMRSEADCRPIMEGLEERRVALCLPAIVEGRMIFRRWAPYQPLVPGGFGTLVPEIHQLQVAPTILIVPLAAFDRRGYRIGYGKGHYDAAIENLKPRVAIGIAFSVQEIDSMPVEPHDRRLDWVVTERETICCG